MFDLSFGPDSSRVRRETSPAGLSTLINEKPNGVTTVVTPDSSTATLTARPDPRFGMQTPIAAQFSVRMPSGLQLTGSSFRKTALTNPADPLTLTSQIDSLVVNGRSFKSVFSAAARTVTATSAEGRQTIAQLDSLGRVIEERAAGVAPVRYDYGPRGFLTTIKRAGRVVRYDYDSTGRVRKVTDPLGRFEQYAYDSVGRVVKQTLFNGQEILYGYDANGNLTSLTPPGRPAHTFAYTANNLDSVYTPPAAGLANPATRYTFNLDGQLTRVVRPDSLAIDVAYDTAGRPSRLTLPNGQMQFVYSPTSGNLATLTAPDGGSLSFTYDGALPKTVTWGGAVQGSVGFKYDSSFRVSKIAVNGTDSIGFSYDRDNLLTSAGAMSLVRDPQNGRLTHTLIENDTSTWAYDDSSGAVLRYTVMHGSTEQFDATYSRDSLDRITQIVEVTQGISSTKAFTYDSLGRLDQYRINGVLVSDYTYDASSNRLAVSTSSGTVTATYDEQDRIIASGGATYKYSTAGELLTVANGSDTTFFSYDAFSNLVKIRRSNGTEVEYILDGSGRRIGRKVDGTLVRGFLYQGSWSPVAELDGSGSVVSRFIYATRTNVPDYMVRDGVKYKIVTDHLGSVRLVINTVTGQVVQRLDFDEYGLSLIDSNPGFQPFGFAGGVSDAVSGFVRFGNRDYDPQTGTWTTRDPIGFGGGGPNLYQYVHGDPVNFVDPSGLGPEDPFNFDLGDGWWARIDRIPGGRGGVPSYEIHVGKTAEVGILGPDGWIGKHGWKTGVQPDLPRNIANRLNGLNSSEARRYGFNPPGGNVKGYFSRDFYRFARGVRAAGVALSVADILGAALRAIRCGRSLLQQLLIDYGLAVDPVTARELLMT
jgi:RHS repeat-associated protein